MNSCLSTSNGKKNLRVFLFVFFFLCFFQYTLVLWIPSQINNSVNQSINQWFSFSPQLPPLKPSQLRFEGEHLPSREVPSFRGAHVRPWLWDDGVRDEQMRMRLYEVRPHWRQNGASVRQMPRGQEEDGGEMRTRKVGMRPEKGELHPGFWKRKRLALAAASK